MRKDKNSLCLSKSKRRDELHERIKCIIKNTPGLEEYIEDRGKDIYLYEIYKLHMWKYKLDNILNKNKTPITLLLKNDMEKSLNVDEVPPFISCASKLIAFLYKNEKYSTAEDVNDMIYSFVMNMVDCYINRINRIDDDSWFEIVSIIDSILEFYRYLERHTKYDKHFCTIPTKIINRLELYIKKVEIRDDVKAIISACDKHDDLSTSECGGVCKAVYAVYDQGEPPVPVHPLYDGEAPEPIPTGKSV